VIIRASDLIRTQHHELSWYEVYFLLTATLFHDVGNLYGRARHERNAVTVMQRVGMLLGNESVEKRLISQIAEAHGGEINGSKDTISRLPNEAVVLNRTVRPQALAALLRFADELADERSRAARYMQANSLLPPQSEIFHKYASALHSVRLTGNMIELYFEIVKSDAVRTFMKGINQVYLFDEIKLRTKKMHFERIYCMRHLRLWQRVDKIFVQIEIYEDEWGPRVRQLNYVFEEDGYPDVTQEVRYSVPHSDNLHSDTSLDGETLRQQLLASTNQSVTGGQSNEA